MPLKRVLTGIQPSGNIHLGNYLGMIRPALERQQGHECFFFIADLHALTTMRDPTLLQTYTLDIVATWLALGFDPSNHMLYRQSDIPRVTELTWYLSCVCGMGLLQKAHAYKDAVANNREITHGVFSYPVLMAADILLYDAELVPVGKDQKQHVEIARDLAGSFNANFGEVLKLPEPVIDEAVMTIPGLDGRKMSKSYGNEIPLFCDQDTLRKKILSIKTDSTPLEQPKALVGSLVGDILRLFGSSAQYSEMEQRLHNGGFGWGHAKAELFEIVNDALLPKRTLYSEFRKDNSALWKVVIDGAAKAEQVALQTLARVRNAVGISKPY